jgi:hypothetical protein
MLEQGSGYLLNVASRTGLLVIFDTISYTVTEHATIGIVSAQGFGASPAICSPSA